MNERIIDLEELKLTDEPRTLSDVHMRADWTPRDIPASIIFRQEGASNSPIILKAEDNVAGFVLVIDPSVFELGNDQLSVTINTACNFAFNHLKNGTSKKLKLSVHESVGLHDMEFVLALLGEPESNN